jgi:hypothetical protein
MSQPMDQLTRERTPRAIATGMWIGLWAGEVIASGEYWLARGASFGLSTLRAYLRRPVRYAAVALIAAGGSLAGAVIVTEQRCSKVDAAQHRGQDLIRAIQSYQVEKGHWPARLEALRVDYAEGLRTDPWGRPYAYYQGEGGAAVVSAGPDGELGTGDDILIVSPPTLKADPDGFVQIVHERGK